MGNRFTTGPVLSCINRKMTPGQGGKRVPEYAPKHGCSGVWDGVIGAQLVYNLDRLSGIQIMGKIRLVVRYRDREDGDGSSSLDHRLCVRMGNWRSLQ